MLTPAEYRQRILHDLAPLDPVRLPLASSRGLVAAEDVRSPIPLPVFDNSAMDGYALRLADLTGSSLPVAGESAAGSPSSALPPGHAMKVMTGAPIPSGADCVVPYEATGRGTVEVTILERPTIGQHVRRRGEDVAVGDVVVPADSVLSPRHLAVIAATGAAEVLVHPAPRIAVISTGAELRQPGEPLTDGAIHDSNSTLLMALASGLGCPVVAHTVADDPLALLDQIAALDADLVITTGGVSAGDYDVVKEALAPRGVWFGPLAMQPGKPQGFGRLDGTPIICLPGNPVSAYVSFYFFVRPAIDRLKGYIAPTYPVRAKLVHPMTSPTGKTQFLRGEYAHGMVSQVRGPGSHLIGALAAANALVEIPADITDLAEGDEVDVWLMEQS